MRTWMKGMMAAGALLVLNGAVARADEMKADVPFAFATPAAQMPAGKYYIQQSGGIATVRVYRLWHAETGQRALVVAPQQMTRPNSSRAYPAQVAFRCNADNCAIAGIYEFGARDGYGTLMKPKAQPATARAANMVFVAAE